MGGGEGENGWRAFNAITYFTEAAYDTTGMHLFENHVIPALQ